MSSGNSAFNNSTLNNELLLYIWPSEWNLPSLDAECLSSLCFLKFSGLSYKIEYVKNPLLLLKNTYPQLHHNNKVYIGLNNIIDYVKSLSNKDSSLNDTNYADMLALVRLFKEKFIPSFVDLCWMDEENTYKVIRSAYGKYLRFPLSMIKLKLLSRDAENFIKCNYKTDYVQYEQIKQQLLIDAKECLNILSSKLSNRTFMIENQPTLLDSILYGYLSILNAAPFVGSSLKNHLISCNNLCLLINRINIEYFPLSKQELENQQKVKEKENKQQKSNTDENRTHASKNKNDNEELRNERKQQIIATCVAVSAMIIYAFSIGFIKIEIQNTEIVQEPLNVD